MNKPILTSLSVISCALSACVPMGQEQGGGYSYSYNSSSSSDTKFFSQINVVNSVKNGIGTVSVVEKNGKVIDSINYNPSMGLSDSQRERLGDTMSKYGVHPVNAEDIATGSNISR